jgi:[acyl-carrier-protein] S-malonyltransferase
MKPRLAIICPGRGSYTKDTLSYLKNTPELQQLDLLRKQQSLPTLSELDQASEFKISRHTKGEHASTLIYACSLQDFQQIPTSEFDIVAITGNSMGWYLALSFAGVLDLHDSYQLIQTMGSMMSDGLIGGQLIYPISNDNWTPNPQERQRVMGVLQQANQVGQAYISIELGGYLVLAGDKEGLQFLSQNLGAKEHYPMKLVNHGAFHTPLLKSVSDLAKQNLSRLNWCKPQVPIIDGRGVVWKPWSTDTSALEDYTLGHQVTDSYDFTKAIEVTLKEFNPDHLVLLGPGDSLGGSIGQILVKNHWRGIHNKKSFQETQKQEPPFLISCGRASQKGLILKD